IHNLYVVFGLYSISFFSFFLILLLSLFLIIYTIHFFVLYFVLQIYTFYLLFVNKIHIDMFFLGHHSLLVLILYLVILLFLLFLFFLYLQNILIFLNHIILTIFYSMLGTILDRIFLSNLLLRLTLNKKIKKRLNFLK